MCSLPLRCRLSDPASLRVRSVAVNPNNRVFDYINQVKKYSTLDADAQLVVAFPEELQKQYENYFKKEDILVWDV